MKLLINCDILFFQRKISEYVERNGLYMKQLFLLSVNF